MKTFAAATLALALLLGLAACLTAERSPVRAAPVRDATAHLLAHAEFAAASRAAPRFVGDALAEITRLERELAARRGP